MKAMVSDVEKRWDEPEAVLNAMAQSEPYSEEEKAGFIAKVQSMKSAADCEQAAGAATEVLRFDETNLDARLVLAECDYKAKDFAGAKTRYLALQSESNDPRILRGLGNIALMEARIDDAKTLLDQAVIIDAGDWRAWNSLGYAEDLRRDWTAAEAAYRKATDLAPGEAAPWNNLGMSLMQQNRFDDAVKAFQTALNVDPGLSVARTNLRVAMAIKGDYAGALADATDKERAVVLNNVGVAALRRGDREVARKMFRDALDASPTFYAVAYSNLERTRLSDGE